MGPRYSGPSVDWAATHPVEYFYDSPDIRFRGPAGGLKGPPFFLADIARPKRRAIFYVDGFNLYFGAVRGTAYKWLNFDAYCQKLHPHDELVKIRYFTSQVQGNTHANQMAFWRALRTTPVVQIQEGKFKRGSVECEHTTCTLQGSRTFQRLQEKRTDVNIAVSMIDDAHRNACENMVVISGDSDLVPAVRLVRATFKNITLFVYVPGHGYEERQASELMQAAHIGRPLNTSYFAECQFPPEFKDRYGRLVRKPKDWT